MTKRYAFKAPKVPLPERVPRIARLLALAHKFQKMLDSGEVESMAELARLGRVSRARITQIMDLLLLAPEIQEDILQLPPHQGRAASSSRELFPLTQVRLWAEPRERWRTALSALSDPQIVEAT